MRGALALLAIGLFVLGLPSLQAGRLDPEPEAQGSTNQTLNETRAPSSNGTAAGVLVFFTDEHLYGFAKPSEAPRRLGNQFDLYLIPLNGSIDYRFLVDDEPVKLSSGTTNGHADSVAIEHLSLPNLRRAHLQIEVTRNNQTRILDYGFVRLRTLADLANDADENAIEDAIKRQLRVFTSGDWTWYTLKVGAISLTAILLGIFAGVNRAREAEESEQSYVVGY
jgi:hypothetical protein